MSAIQSIQQHPHADHNQCKTNPTKRLKPVIGDKIHKFKRIDHPHANASVQVWRFYRQRAGDHRRKYPHYQHSQPTQSCKNSGNPGIDTRQHKTFGLGVFGGNFRLRQIRDLLFRRFVKQQKICRNMERTAKLHQTFRIGQRIPSLPFADRLAGNAAYFSELFLRKAILHTQCANFFSDHLTTSFPFFYSLQKTPVAGKHFTRTSRNLKLLWAVFPGKT